MAGSFVTVKTSLMITIGGLCLSLLAVGIAFLLLRDSWDGGFISRNFDGPISDRLLGSWVQLFVLALFAGPLLALVGTGCLLVALLQRYLERRKGIIR